MWRISARVLLAIAAIIAVMSTSIGVASAATTRIDVTIEETFPLTTGTVIAGAIPGCDNPTTTTGPVTVNRGAEPADLQWRQDDHL